MVSARPAKAILFGVPGRPVSANRVTRRFGNRSVKSAEATTYQQRVFQHAFAAAQTCKWKKPEACSVKIFAYNSALDADNMAKCILDGMNGAIYHDDKAVIELHIQKYKDHDGHRLIVHVNGVQPARAPAEEASKEMTFLYYGDIPEGVFA